MQLDWIRPAGTGPFVQLDWISTKLPSPPTKDAKELNIKGREQPPCYAEVVVLGIGQRSTLTYLNPLAHRQQLRPGHLVSVPFGERIAQGVVFTVLNALSPDLAVAPVPLKEIFDLLDPIPVLLPTQLALACWIATEYHCSLAAATVAMLPAGMSQKAVAVLRLASSPEEVTSALPLEQRALVGLIRTQSHAQVPLSYVQRSLGKRAAASALAPLLEEGILTRQSELSASTLRPKYEQVVRLTSSKEMVRAWQTEMARRLANSSKKDGNGEQGSAFPGQGRLNPTTIQRQSAALDLMLGQETPWKLGELRKASNATSATFAALTQAGLIAIETQEVRRDPYAHRHFADSAALPLTTTQRLALERILEAALAPAPTGEPHVFLLHGITGSGKTEVYLQALAAVLVQGKRALILIPEIALTPQTVSRFSSRFPGQIAVIHSALSPGERYDEWRRIRSGEASVVIGSRSAIFSPLPDLGLIVIDEEHEWSYKQDRSPRYHTRDVAIELARLSGATVVLGSATPAVPSYHAASTGRFKLLELKERAPTASKEAARLPPVQIVDLRAELRAGNTSILSRPLHAAIEETLRAGQQIILFLNRRGSASCVLCRDCGYVCTCGQCDAPLTHHATYRSLICHYCNRHSPAPRVCPNCQGSRIKYFGLGTEKVQEVVGQLFPQARIMRWDRDSVRGKHAHEELLERFSNHQADILVGTQMIAKGLDVPNVTLVGVVSADVALYLPDYHSSERAFQLLTQVAGRAGRGPHPGRVIIQTFSPDHFSIQAASQHNYHTFYKNEMDIRRRFGYPPFRRFVKFTYSHTSSTACEEEAYRFADHLQVTLDELALPHTDLVGPAPAFMTKLQGKYRWQILARGPDLHPLLQAATIPLPWSVDVDPVSTL